MIHAAGGEQDVRRLGGLRRHLPVTYWTFVAAWAAIAGLPFLSGFFSKDQILAAAFAEHKLLWLIGWVTAGLTAFYMTRALLLTFGGEFRGSEQERAHLHESPRVMTVPLVVLAVGAVGAGWVGIPVLGSLDVDWIGHFLEPVVAAVGAAEGHGEGHASVALELALMGLSVAIALAGIAAAWSIYGRNRGLAGGEAWARRFPALHRLLVHKYFVDEIYDRVIVRPIRGLARGLWKIVDALIIDRGLVHGVAFLTEITGDIGRFSTTGNVRSYALYFLGGLLVLFVWLIG